MQVLFFLWMEPIQLHLLLSSSRRSPEAYEPRSPNEPVIIYTPHHSTLPTSPFRHAKLAAAPSPVDSPGPLQPIFGILDIKAVFGSALKRKFGSLGLGVCS